MQHIHKPQLKSTFTRRLIINLCICALLLCKVQCSALSSKKVMTRSRNIPVLIPFQKTKSSPVIQNRLLKHDNIDDCGSTYFFNREVHTSKQFMEERRHFLSTLLFTTTSLTFPLSTVPSTNAIDIPFLSASSKPLLRTKALTPLDALSPSNNNKYGKLLVSPGAGTDTTPITYPFIFLGKWKLTSTFREKTYPLGERFVPSRIRKRGSIRRDIDKPGDSISYYQIYDKNSNSQNNGIYSNRIYNVQQQINAQRGYEEVAEVKYDMKKQRITILLNTLGPDMQPLPPGRNEIFITNHGQEYSINGRNINDYNNAIEEASQNKIEEEKKIEEGLLSGNNESPYHFSTMEFFRTISLGVRSTSVLETAAYTAYELDPNDQNKIIGRQRICLYLPPLPSGEEGDMYFEANNRAVAIFDYDLVMEKILQG